MAAKNHNWWLDWKLRHGLARRGRVGGTRGPLQPKGRLANFLHRVWYHRDDEPPPPPPKSKSERMDHRYIDPHRLTHHVHIQSTATPEGGAQ